MMALVRLAGYVSPDSALANAAHRATMAAAFPRLAGNSGRAPRAIARALRTTALAPMPADERRWVTRIEASRRHVPAKAGELGEACPWWSTPRLWGRFLMRLVRELEPRSCLELGVGFGISGAYQAAALKLNGSGRLVTLDQEESLARIAEDGFRELRLASTVELCIGPIGRTLPQVLPRLAPLDYAYIDAEHTYEATVANYEALLPHITDCAVVVVDDIKLDQGMSRAWDAIRSHERVSLQLGLRRLGVVVVSGA